MKKISVLFTIFCFLLASINIYGQDSENNWQFSFGINAVDLDADSSTKLQNFLMFKIIGMFLNPQFLSFHFQNILEIIFLLD